MNSASAIEVRLPSELGYEKVAMCTAAGVAQMMGFSPERIEDLKTALAEACINAIEHGNHMDRSLYINVELATSDTELEIKVSDEGNGPAEQPVRPDIDRKMQGQEGARGMGVFLIQALVDEAEWHKGPPGKNYVRLVFRLDNKDNR